MGLSAVFRAPQQGAGQEALRPAPGSSGRVTSPSGFLVIHVRPEAVSGPIWGEESRGDQVLSYRSFRGAFLPGFGPPGEKWRGSDPHVAAYQRALPASHTQLT